MQTGWELARDSGEGRHLGSGPPAECSCGSGPLAFSSSPRPWKPAPSPPRTTRLVGHEHRGLSCSPHGCEGRLPDRWVTTCWLLPSVSIGFHSGCYQGRRREKREGETGGRVEVGEEEEEWSLIPGGHYSGRTPLPLSCGTRVTNRFSLPGTKGAPRSWDFEL